MYHDARYVGIYSSALENSSVDSRDSQLAGYMYICRQWYATEVRRRILYSRCDAHLGIVNPKSSRSLGVSDSRTANPPHPTHASRFPGRDDGYAV